ncbi:MAG: hypothetical protein OEV89_05370 [Desulfobulbaceae bacterium]|nr:hypothetical protein [Desulfobulbaceae bacterium]HIJ90181.1 hypothetical protein [Deltaproteobacteria bacterium]
MGVKKWWVYKFLNGESGVGEGVVGFMMLFQAVVLVKVFLYQREKDVFWQTACKCPDGRLPGEILKERGTKNYTSPRENISAG